jgi:hypothetical protein
MKFQVGPLCTSLSGGTQSTHRENRGFHTLLLNRLPDLCKQKKRILGTRLVKARIVNTYPPFLILLLSKYRLC